MSFLKKVGKLFGGRGNGRPVTIAIARKICGKKFVLLPTGKLKKLPGISKLPSDIGYDEETIKNCAKENAKGEQWRLVLKLGLSVLDLSGALKKLKIESFCMSSVWTLREEHPKEYGWLSCVEKPGYRLINLKPVSTATAKVLSPHMEPANIATVAEALIFARIAYKERFLENAFHAGKPVGGIIPIIGGYDAEDILLYTVPDDFLGFDMSECNVGVVMCKVPE